MSVACSASGFLPAPRDPVDRYLASVSHEMVDVVYQPIVDLAAGTVIGYEVLSRPRGIVAAISTVFRRAREAADVWSLERACWAAAFREIAALPGRSDDMTFFVNLSPAAIVADRVAELLATASAVDPRSIVLEITEQESIPDHEAFEAAVSELSACGFRFAVDDFGAGHSGLRTLVAARPDFVKLDVSLTRRLDGASYRREVVAWVVSLSASVGATLIAEGVESWDDLRVLRDIGIGRAQGFLLGFPARHPLPPAPEIRMRLGA